MQITLTRANHASVLLVTVFITGFLTLILGGFLYLASYENTAVARSQIWNESMVAAEAGIEEGLSMINRFAGTTTPIENWSERAIYNGWENLGGNTYLMQRTIGGAFYRVYITNQASPMIKSIGYVYNPKTRAYLSRAVYIQNAGGSYFRAGILAKRGVRLSGSLSIDSFNSQDPASSTGGRYDITKRRDNGNVGTVVSNLVSAIVGSGSAQIRGRLATGPASTIQTAGSFSSGSSAWVAAGNHGIQAGWSQNDLNLYVPEAPPLPSGTYFALPAPGSVTINAGGGTVRYYYNSSYNMNNYNYLQITNGTVILDARDGLRLNAQAEIRIAPGSRLVVYLGSSDTRLNGGGVINTTGYATNCVFYGKNNCTQIEVNGSAAFIGQIYAPYSNIQLNGNSDIIGSMVGDTFDVNGSFAFHYDESLSGPNSGSSAYRVVAWREVTP